MKLSQLEIFYHTADTHSFTQAAHILDLSKGYVSTQVTALEKEIKTKLLNRTTRHISLTSDGQKLFEIAKNIVSEKTRAIQLTEKQDEELTGTLTISAPASISEAVISPMLQEFHKEHPNLIVNLITSHSIDNLASKGIDVAIRATTTPNENLIAKFLTSFNFVLCATPTYLAQNSKINTPQDLYHHNCLVYSADPAGNEWPFEINDQHTSIQVSGNLISTNHNVLKQAVMENRGLVRLPDYSIQKEVSEGSLIEVLAAYTTLQLPLYAVYAPSKTKTSPKIKAFIEYLENFLKG